MKVIVVSDNHGDTYYMEEILSIHNEDTTAWFHCGDSELPAEHPLFQKYKSVKGNMDFEKKLKDTLVVELEGEPFLIAHGHLHSVKRSFDPLVSEAREANSRMVLYGHTHIPKVDKEEGIFFVNPGSITQPRDRELGTYLAITIPDDKSTVTFTYYDRDHNEVSELNSTFSLTQ
ncbi:metallophosphoesterase family protein [Alkalibacterium sp. MB6]|uniref:metallophosphoesterase family protein n=1 Tax=Alkalibacterium sp. MB6 TaxID=2081965 RepID=UPI0013794D8A|nr:metallophosphoesterase [Alkalibacterium sp. MB6]